MEKEKEKESWMNKKKKNSTKLFRSLGSSIGNFILSIDCLE